MACRRPRAGAGLDRVRLTFEGCVTSRPRCASRRPALPDSADRAAARTSRGGAGPASDPRPRSRCAGSDPGTPHPRCRARRESQLAGSQQPDQPDRVATVGLDLVTRPFGIRPRRVHAHIDPALRDRPRGSTPTSIPRRRASPARANPVGPASYTATTAVAKPPKNPTSSSGAPSSWRTASSPESRSSTAAVSGRRAHQDRQATEPSSPWSAPSVCGCGPPREC